MQIGDFTGYDRRRIFNNIEPYNGSPQLVLKSHFFVPSTLTSSKNITPVWLEKRTYPFWRLGIRDMASIYYKTFLLFKYI